MDRPAMLRLWRHVLAKTEGVIMGRNYWACGFVLLAAIATNPQVILDVSCENLGNEEVNPPAPFLEYLRQAEVGYKYEK